MKQLRMYTLIVVLAIFTGCEHEKEHDHDDHSHDDSDSTAATLNR
jgi:hypothetical protein